MPVDGCRFGMRTWRAGGLMLDPATRIAVAGAGSIGCYAGGCLALAGRKVTLLARPRIVEAVGKTGLTIVDLDGSERRLAPSALTAQSRSGGGLRRRGPRAGHGEERRHGRDGGDHRPPCAAGCHRRQPAERNRQCSPPAAIAAGHAARGRRHGAVQRGAGRNAGRTPGVSADHQRRDTRRSRCARPGRSA